MLNKININSKKQKLVIYVFLAAVTLAVYGQVHQHDFVYVDDFFYVTGNSFVQSGITPGGLHWAFTTTNQYLWNPLVWLSLMLDCNLYGMNAGGYHVTNLILHVMSTLLLFWLFSRMTGMIWRSAFVAAFFALHPLHVESVAWIAERKDVLSAFAWMLTLCFYVRYTEKPGIKRYIPVLFSFVLAMMSKPIAVTLPVIMILLDYWPLKRFQSEKDNPVLRQIKEKAVLFILAAVFSIVTICIMSGSTYLKYYPLDSRLANAFVSFTIYAGKIFWPHAMAVFYPFPMDIPAWQVTGSVLLLMMITAAVIAMMKRRPYFFTGWLWYVLTILPVAGIIQNGNYAMADRYAYLPSVGISVMLAWGIPLLFRGAGTRKKILFPAGAAVLVIMAVLTWKQCGYWKNSITLFDHALRVTKDNIAIHNMRGLYYGKRGLYRLALEDFNEAVRLEPYSTYTYYNRINAYAGLGLYQRAIEDFNTIIGMRPDYVTAYNDRGMIYIKLGRYRQALDDFNKAVSLNPDGVDAYNNRGAVYLHQGNNRSGCSDARRACELGNCKLLEFAKMKGFCR